MKKKLLFSFLLLSYCAITNAQLSVFTDNYAAGATFVDFGGAINNVSIDNTVAQSGTSSLKVVVPSTSYVGGAIKAAANQNLSSYNAVSFWVRASANKTLNVSGISNNGTTAVFQAEYNNITVSTTWKKCIIPLPAPGKLTAEDGLFHFAEGSDEGAYTLWFDDIQYENSPAVGAFSPAIATQTLSPLVGGTFTPTGTVLNVLVNSVNQVIDVKPACFNFTSSNNAVATVTNGVGTAVGAGSATITATLNGVNATGTITVNVGASSSPMTAAPTPTRPAANVISLFSNAYTNVPNTNWNPNWGQSTVVTDVQIAGNDTKRYQNLNYQGIEFQTAINASQMQFLHVDIWTPNCTAFELYLINPGPIEKAFVINPTASGWNSVDIPLSHYNTINLSNIFQIKLVGTPFGTSLVWMDNLYFYKTGTVNVPTVAAPTPTRPATNVFSLFSNAYTNYSGIDWNPNWGQSTTVADISIAGNTTKKYENMNYQGIEFTPAINVSNMQFVHFDLWTPNATSFQFFLINPGPIEKSATVTPTAGTWNSYDIPLSTFNTINLSNVFQIKLESVPFGTSTVYLDNIYFYTTAAVGVPGVAAPTPTRLPSFVKSLFSDAYTNVAGTDWNPNWGQSTTVADISISGNTTKRYSTLNYQGILLNPAFDATGMEFLHFDLWTPNATSFQFFLINPGPVEKSATVTPTAGTWNSYDIPLTTFNTINLSNIFQMKLESVPFGTSTVYLDNIYFYKNPPSAPLTAAPNPTRPAANVISLFSNAYTNVANIDWNPNWGQSTAVSDISISGNTTKLFNNLNYQGTQFASPINASSMEFLHVDLWTGTCNSFDIFLINTSPTTKEQKVTLTPTAFGWNSFDIPLSSYNTIALNNIGQIKWEGRPSGCSVYLDNIYFYNTPTLSVSSNNLTIGAPANSTQTFAITSNTSWTASSNESWLNVGTLSGVGNASITLTATANTSTSTTRTATVTIAGPGFTSKTITVIQDKEALFLNASPNNLTANASGTNLPYFEVKSNTNWNVSINQNWLSSNITSGNLNATITMQVQANPKITTRTAIVTVSASGVPDQTITVVQDAGAPSLTLPVSNLTIDAPANSSQTFDVISNTSWTVSSNQTWLSPNALNGNENSTITLAAQANTSTNTRTATITVTGLGLAPKIITVTQKGTSPSISVSSKDVTIAAPNNSQKTVDIVSNTNWTVTSSQTWLTLSSATGSDNATLTLTAEENTSTFLRTAQVVVSATGASDQTINVTQEAGKANLAVNVNALTIAAAANSTKTFDVTSNTDWTVTSSEAWLVASSLSGTANSTITLTADANPNPTIRTATITVAASGVTSQVILVTQDAAGTILTVNPSSLTIAAAANSTKTFDITSNVAWTLVSSESWLTADKTSGSNNASITLTAAENLSAKTRTATVTISASGAGNQMITVTQDAAAATLSIIGSDITVAAIANNAKSFEIKSNTDWSVKTNQSWLKFDKPSGNGDSTITLIVEANPLVATRKATVTISATGVADQTLSVTQEAAAVILSVSATDLTVVSPANSTTTFEITSNADWNVFTNQQWLKSNASGGFGNVKITLTAQENTLGTTRVAKVFVSAKGVPDKVITVTQDAASASLSVSVTMLTIAAPANSTKTFDITSNTNWTLTSSESWLAASSVNGTGNATITLTAQENATKAVRTATVTVKAAGLADKTIIVTQDFISSVNNNYEKTAFSLYPNPANDNLIIKLLNFDYQDYELSINDLSGKVIMSIPNFENQKNIDVSFLPQGVYLVQLQNSKTKTISTNKLIKL